MWSCARSQGQPLGDRSRAMTFSRSRIAEFLFIMIVRIGKSRMNTNEHESRRRNFPGLTPIECPPVQFVKIGETCVSRIRVDSCAFVVELNSCGPASVAGCGQLKVGHPAERR